MDKPKIKRKMVINKKVFIVLISIILIALIVVIGMYLGNSTVRLWIFLLMHIAIILQL